MTAKQLQILETYDDFDDDEISTERLLALVCDICECDVTEVVKTLLLNESISKMRE